MIRPGFLKFFNVLKSTRPVHHILRNHLSLSVNAISEPKVNSIEQIQKLYETSLQHDDFFDVRKLVTIEDLFRNRAHLGHKTGSLNPHMVPYLYGERLGVCIFDLNQTVKLFQDALNIVAHIAFRKGVILFINNSKDTAFMTEQTAIECGEYSHCRDFEANTFTNSERFFGTVIRLPDLIIFLKTKNSLFFNHVAVDHAAKLLIPTIGIVDSTSDPRLISYPIPANDDTSQSIQLYCDLFKQAILAGKQKREQLIGNV